MDEKDHLLKTLEHFRQQRAAKIQETRSLDAIIRGLEQELGVPATSSETTETMVISEQAPATNVSGPLPLNRPDEFFSMTQTDAAKAYLKKAGRAISMDQLLDGMKRGGAHVGGADPKATLYVSLMRNPKKEFVKVSEGYIGLREFYPSLPKSLKNGMKKSPKTNKKKKRPGLKRSFFPRLNPNEVKTAIRKTLDDGQLHSAQEILDGVRAQFKFKVNPVVVYGCLKNKEFEKLEGQYRLKK